MVMKDKLFALSFGFAALILFTKAHAQVFDTGQQAACYATATQSIRSESSSNAHNTKV